MLNTLRPHDRFVSAVAFPPNGGVVASGSGDHTIALHDVSTAGLRAKLRGHSGPVFSVAFAQGGRTLVSASADGTVGLWDVSSGSLLQRLEGHSSEVYTGAPRLSFWPVRRRE